MPGPYLIFCSLEVSGLPYEMAEVLNKHGERTYYISIARRPEGHDSTLYQLGPRSQADWDLSHHLAGLSWNERVSRLKRCDQEYGFGGVLATGDLCYMLAQAEIPYLYWCFGVDLDQLDYRRSWTAPLPWWRRLPYLAYFFLVVRARMLKTLRGARKFMLVPYQRHILEKQIQRPEFFFFPHILPTIDWAELNERRQRARFLWQNQLQASRIFFSAVRHFWSGPRAGLWEDKANHIALRGFARYVQKTGDYGARFATIQAGPDVAASQALARQLGIADQLIWLPHTSRQKLEEYYLAADFTLGNFAFPLVSFAVVEPLRCGSPCISRLLPYEGVPTYKPLPPVLHAESPEGVAEALERGSRDETWLQSLSYQSWSWAKECASEKSFVRSFRDLFHE